MDKMEKGKKIILIARNGEIDWNFNLGMNCYALNTATMEFENCTGISNEEMVICQPCDSTDESLLNNHYVIYNTKHNVIGVAEIVNKRAYIRDIAVSCGIDDFTKFLKEKLNVKSVGDMFNWLQIDANKLPITLETFFRWYIDNQ